MILRLFNRSGSDRATDPVCEMQVDVRKPPGGTFEYQGRDLLLLRPWMQPRLPKGAGRLPVGREEDRDVTSHLP